MSTFSHVSDISGVTPADLCAWHFAPGALQRLLPPGRGITVRRSAPLAEGSEVELALPFGPCRVRWLARHSAINVPEGFVDEQVSGPFSAWRHQHRFSAVAHGARLSDEITYTMPGGALTAPCGSLVAHDLQRMFTWRHERTRRDLLRQLPFRDRPRMVVGISGATGLVASELTPFLTTAGHTVKPFVRGRATTEGIAWDPARGTLDESALAQCDAVVHLAGASVASRWTATHRAAIMDSRIRGTRLVAEAVARQARAGRPMTLIIASGVNCYPGTGEPCTEDSPATGSGFLADVVRAWEAAADPAREAGVRVVHLRIGMVLSPAGGGLAQLLTPARLGLGGPVGAGTQLVSWIDLDDLVGLIHQTLHDARLQGVVNACAPEVVPQRVFAQTLGRLLHRPACAPFPAWAVRAALGQMGEELLLTSLRVVPQRAQAAGFTFNSPDLVTALRFALG
jgi:hypothetical protein